MPAILALVLGLVRILVLQGPALGERGSNISLKLVVRPFVPSLVVELVLGFLPSIFHADDAIRDPFFGDHAQRNHDLRENPASDAEVNESKKSSSSSQSKQKKWDRRRKVR